MQGGVLDEILRLALDRWHRERPSWRVDLIYLFGSRAYGCASDTSDWDFMFVVSGPLFQHPQVFDDDERYQINAYHIEFLTHLAVHEQGSTRAVLTFSHRNLANVPLF